MDSNWVHGLTGKFHNHRPYTRRAGVKSNPFVGRPSTSIPRLQIQRQYGNFHSSSITQLPQLSIRKNLMPKPEPYADSRLFQYNHKPEPNKITPESGPEITPESGPGISPELGPAITPEFGPEITPNDPLEGDDSLSNQLVNFLNPEIEIKSEPNFDVDAEYLD